LILIVKENCGILNTLCIEWTCFGTIKWHQLLFLMVAMFLAKQQLRKRGTSMFFYISFENFRLWIKFFELLFVLFFSLWCLFDLVVLEKDMFIVSWRWISSKKGMLMLLLSSFRLVVFLSFCLCWLLQGFCLENVTACHRN
jgi:hypothetical protein